MINPDKLISLAERTFNTEVDEVPAEDILQLVNKIIEPVQPWALHDTDGSIDRSLMVFGDAKEAQEASLRYDVEYSPWRLTSLKI